VRLNKNSRLRHVLGHHDKMAYWQKQTKTAGTTGTHQTKHKDMGYNIFLEINEHRITIFNIVFLYWLSFIVINGDMFCL